MTRFIKTERQPRGDCTPSGIGAFARGLHLIGGHKVRTANLSSPIAMGEETQNEFCHFLLVNDVSVPFVDNAETKTYKQSLDPTEL